MSARTNARNVAFIYLIGASVWIMITSVAFVAAIWFSVYASMLEKDPMAQSEIGNSFMENLGVANSNTLITASFVSAAAHNMWIRFGIYLIVTIFKTVAASRLNDATQLGIAPAKGAKLARSWLNVTINFMILEIVVLCSVLVPDGRYLAALLVVNFIIYDFIFILEVSMFIAELEENVLPTHVPKKKTDSPPAYETATATKY